MFLRTQENFLVGIDFQNLADVLTGQNAGLHTSPLNIFVSLDVAAEPAVWAAGKSYVVERSHDDWLVSLLFAGVEVYQKQALKIRQKTVNTKRKIAIFVPNQNNVVLNKLSS